MANGYTNSSTNILEAAFGFDLCPQNQQGLLRRTCLMACALARALFFCDDLFFSWVFCRIRYFLLVVVFLFLSTQN